MRHYSTFLPIDPFCLQPRAEPRDYASLNSAARQIAAARTRPFALSTQTSSFEVLRPPRSLSPTGLTRSGPAFFVAPCRLRTPQPNSQTQPRVRRVCYACSIALQCRSLRRKSDEWKRGRRRTIGTRVRNGFASVRVAGNGEEGRQIRRACSSCAWHGGYQAAGAALCVVAVSLCAEPRTRARTLAPRSGQSPDAHRALSRPPSPVAAYRERFRDGSCEGRIAPYASAPPSGEWHEFARVWTRRSRAEPQLAASVLRDDRRLPRDGRRYAVGACAYDGVPGVWMNSAPPSPSRRHRVAFVDAPSSSCPVLWFLWSPRWNINVVFSYYFFASHIFLYSTRYWFTSQQRRVVAC